MAFSGSLVLPVLAGALVLSGCSPRATELSSLSTTFGYGINVADPRHTPLVGKLGFDWAKTFVSWETAEVEPGSYDWSELDDAVGRSSEQGLKLLLRVDRAPAWAHPSTAEPVAPPDPEFLADWGRFLQAMAYRGRGSVQAYEVWNEPNLAVEWGQRRPEPARYVALLRTAYLAIKAADPQALVVSAGLAPTTTNDETATDNLLFLDAMYRAGAASYFDVLGSHPHGGAQGPAGAEFGRTALEREVMARHNDAAKFSWATEMAWLIEPPAGCRTDPRWSTKLTDAVSPQGQAQYLTDAFRFVRSNWSWMNAIFVFNLDFMAAPWYDACEPMGYESLVDANAVPRPAFDALARLAKPGISARSSWPLPIARLLSTLRGDDGAVSRANLNAFPRGPLLKDPCNGIWVVADGARRWIPDVETFEKARYHWDEVLDSDLTSLTRFTPGLPLSSVKSGPRPQTWLGRAAGADPVFEIYGFARRTPVADYSALQRTEPCTALRVLDLPPSVLEEIPIISR